MLQSTRRVWPPRCGRRAGGDLRRRRRRPEPRNRAAGPAGQSRRARGRPARQQRPSSGDGGRTTDRARSSTWPTWPRRRSSRRAWPAPPTRFRSPASTSSISGTDAPRDGTLREMYGDLAPVAVIYGEKSDTPGDVVACPGRDLRVHEGDWTAMIGTADELAAQGIAVAKPVCAPDAGSPFGRARVIDAVRALPRRHQSDVLPRAGRVDDAAARARRCCCASPTSGRRG